MQLERTDLEIFSERCSSYSVDDDTGMLRDQILGTIHLQSFSMFDYVYRHKGI